MLLQVVFVDLSASRGGPLHGLCAGMDATSMALKPERPTMPATLPPMGVGYFFSFLAHADLRAAPCLLRRRLHP